MKAKILRIGILLLVAVALAFGMEALQIATQPKAYEAEPRVIREAGELDFEKCELTGCELKDGAILVREPGATITVDFGQETDVIRPQLWSRKVLKEDVPIRVFWAGNGEDFAEERSVSLTLENGGKGWEVEVPEGKYAKLRFEMNGRISISGIQYAEAIEERAALQEGLRLWRVGLLIPILFAVLLFLDGVHAGKRLAGVCRRAWQGLTGNWKRTLCHVGIFALAAAAGYFGAKLLFLGGLTPEMNAPREAFCAAVALTVACLLTFRKTLGKKPENLFLVLVLTAGSLMTFLWPAATLVGLDDEYHFDHALTYSYLGEERLTAQDELNILQDANTAGGFGLGQQLADWKAREDENERAGVTEILPKGLELKNAFEIIPGFGLYLGRVLGLSYSLKYSLGRFFSLLAYAVCGYFAIRRLKSGKMVAALCLLVPTAVAQACNYSYDTGLNGFMALGMAYVFGAWQRQEEKITWGEAGIMYGSMAFGALAKAVYFPMMLLPLFLPKAKFAGKEGGKPGEMSRTAFLLLNVGAVVLVLATFVVPLLLGQSEGDGRGGDDVDVYGQIAHILGNPMGYADLLLKTIRDLKMGYQAVSVVNLFGYMGSGSYTWELLALLVIVAFTDRNRTEAAMIRSLWRRWIGLFLLFGTLCLVCTSMYLIFNPVGAEWIGGCQPRYMIPLIFPTLMLSAPEVLAWIAWDKIYWPAWVVIPLILILVVFLLWRVFPELEIGGRRIFPKTKSLSVKQKEGLQALYNGIALALAMFILFSGIFSACIQQFVG